MEVWKIIFLSKWVICRFHVNLPGCMELMAMVWYGASIWPASVHAGRISSSSLVCCIAMSRSNSHEIPWKSYPPLKLT